MPTFNTNLRTGATTRYTGFDFKSYAMVNGYPMAAGAEGLYRLCADSDLGVDIPSVIELPIIRLGAGGNDRLRKVYMTYSSDGDLLFSADPDGKGYTSFNITSKKSGKQTIVKTLSRDMKGGTWQFKIENVGGSYFALYGLAVLINERHVNIV